MAKRKTQSAPYGLVGMAVRAMKKRRTQRTTTRPRIRVSRSRIRRRAAVKSLPKNRIGSNNGLISSNQKVPRPKAGSVQYRRSNYGVIESLDKVWVGASSVCQHSTHFRTISHAILAYYLPKMGDMRATNDQVPDPVPVFGTFAVQYAKDAPGTGPTSAQFVTGASISNASYTSMATTLSIEMLDKARTGLYPTAIAFVHPVGGIGTNSTVLRDTNVGRHVITVSVSGRFRFQNVTPAAAGDGAAASHNINAVDANPLNGKIYTFRNQAPLFASSYVSTLTDSTTVDGIKSLQDAESDFEVYGITASGVGGKGGDAFKEIPAPPLNPSSVWRNTKSTGVAVFPPGGFKTYTTSYLRSATIATYIRDFTQADQNTFSVWAEHTKYPPAGDSFMMCLRPTIKSTSEIIKLAYNSEYILKASIKKRKPTALQVVNDIE